MHKKSVKSLVITLVVLMVYLFTNINVYAANPLNQVKQRTFGEYKPGSGVNHNQDSSNTGYYDEEDDPPNANYDLYYNIKEPSNSAYDDKTSFKDEYGNGAYSTHLFFPDDSGNEHYFHIYSNDTQGYGYRVKTYVDEMSKGSDINFALVRFVIYNDNNSDRTVRLATTADIMIGADDNAPAANIKLNSKSGVQEPSGFYTTNQMCWDESEDNKITLNYYFKNDYYIDQVSKNDKGQDTSYTVNYNVVNWQQRFNKEVMKRNYSNGNFNKNNFIYEHSGVTAGGTDSAFVANWVVTVPAQGTATVAYAFEVTEAKSEFTVKYDSNGGTGSIASKTAEYNENITLSNNLDENNNPYMTKDKYELVGWNEVQEAANEGNVQYELGDSLMVIKDTTLYAVWKAPSSKLTFDANGGEFKYDEGNTEHNLMTFDNPTYTVNVKYNSGDYNDMSKDIPQRTGYTFAGWYTDKTGGTPVYDINGYAVQKSDDNDHWVVSGDTKRYDSNWMGGTYTNWWNMVWNGITDTTLYAHWIPNEYTLTIDPNGGEMYNGDNKTTDSFTTIAVYDRKTYLGNLKSNDYFYPDNKPTRTGYAFTGFTFSNGTGGLNSSGDRFYFSNRGNSSTTSNTYIYNGDYAGDVTATAGWKAYILTLTYNANGGYFTEGAKTTQNISYDTSESLSYTEPIRSGYSFEGWTDNSKWKDEATKFTNKSGSKTGQDWASEFGTNIDSSDKSVTLYAQWTRTITHTFYYYNNQSVQADVIFHNDDESKTMTIPEVARGTDKTYDGYDDWAFRGFSTGTLYDSEIKIGKDNSQITVKNTDSDTTYYAQYQRTTTITYIDYGDDEKQTNTQQDTAYLNYNGGSVFSPEFKARTQNTMKYTENSVSGTKKETWNAIGWTTKTAQNATAEKQAGDSIISYKDMTYYGLYKKDVTLTYNPNGGTVSRTSNSYTRYANASNVAGATKETYTMPTPTWTENYVTKYNFGAWTYDALTPNSDFYSKLVGTNNGYGQFTYTPLVSDTVYAAWTNKSNPTAYEPEVTVTKEAVWNTPSSDNSAVDFDAKQNIDIDGIAKVTVKVNITNKNNIGAKDINVTDYFNTDMWDYYQTEKITPNVSTGTMSPNENTITWTIPNNTTGTATLTYYVKIKEPYWNVDDDTNDYINKIPELNKYLASLTDSSKNPGTASNDNFYYCSSEDASKAYVWVSYKISSGRLADTDRKIHNATPYVVMRQVNWIPTVHQVGIESKTNNIYHNIDSDYTNTYFVRYDTKGANSLFKIYERSQLSRSYSYYQITNNIMDMQSVNKTQEVIDNALAINSMKSDTWSNTTSSKLSSGFKALDLLKVSEADNDRGSNTENGVEYKYGSLTSYDTNYATNQDGLKFSLYPFVRTTNSKTGKTYETTRNTSKLANKRLDLIIDATDPIITADDRIQTKSDTYGDWTESDGYMDINLVNSNTNPTAAPKELTFKFEDKVSGVNSPDVDKTDWIETSSDNVQVTLKRVDNEPKKIFDSNDTPSNNNDYVKVTYDNKTGKMNKTGSVKVTLNPENKDVLGHLKLTIRVYDNVGNWTEKTYDLYVFCLTGAVEISDSLPDYLTRQLSLNQFRNGEMGVVKVSAGGYADRVTVDFGTYLDKLYKDEYSKRGSLFNDKVTTINGDYPNTDAKDVSGAEYDSSMTYLPYNLQVNTWGYTSDTLGGLRLNNVEAKKYVTTVDNSILQKHLNSLIVRYQELKENKYNIDEYDNTYAILGSTLYTYPVVEKGQITSYTHKYELGGETYYNEKVYPAYITVDGTKGIDIIYNTIEGDNSKMAASVESTTEINISNWTAVGNSYLRPFIHYFYMPLEANKKTTSDPYYVTLTEYKDSEKVFKHSVNIKLSFYNNLEPRAKFIETYIKDN